MTTERYGHIAASEWVSELHFTFAFCSIMTKSLRNEAQRQDYALLLSNGSQIVHNTTEKMKMFLIVVSPHNIGIQMKRKALTNSFMMRLIDNRPAVDLSDIAMYGVALWSIVQA